MVFDRNGSTLGVMDDLQFAIHSYDGCARGCSGCLVDKHFKNHQRFQPIINQQQMKIIHSRVTEYYDWAKQNLNTKSTGYFGAGKQQINHYSYTFRFGNHSELPYDYLVEMSETMNAEFKVFSTAPTEDISKFIQLSKNTSSKLYLEIIYDPTIDNPYYLRDMIVEMRNNNILGYPEVLITQKLISYFTPALFVEKCVAPLGDIGTQMQFGRYTPSKTRNFNASQSVPIDQEVEWLAEVAKLIVQQNLNIHPIPIGEYAVTFLDEYDEHLAQRDDGSIDESKLEEKSFNSNIVIEHTKDIFASSLYIDHNLDLFVWSESMGQHVLDSNFGFPKLGNIIELPIHEIIYSKNSILEQMAKNTIKHLITHKKCAPCRYKSFCASHAIPFFRNFMEDNGMHCYGYLPVIREFQKDRKFLSNMVDGFKKLGF